MADAEHERECALVQHGHEPVTEAVDGGLIDGAVDDLHAHDHRGVVCVLIAGGSHGDGVRGRAPGGTRRVSFALVRLRVLGPLQLCDEKGRTVALRSPNQAVVLAVLVAHRGSVVSASTLIDALWGADPPASALATLRTYVSRLRGVVGPAIATRGDGWMFDVDVVPVDADEFEESVRGNPPGAAPPDPITVGRAGARPM